MRIRTAGVCRITSQARGSGAEGDRRINKFTPSPHTQKTYGHSIQHCPGYTKRNGSKNTIKVIR